MVRTESARPGSCGELQATTRFRKVADFSVEYRQVVTSRGTDTVIRTEPPSIRLECLRVQCARGRKVTQVHQADRQVIQEKPDAWMVSSEGCLGDCEPAFSKRPSANLVSNFVLGDGLEAETVGDLGMPRPECSLRHRAGAKHRGIRLHDGP